jgi:hypothetical protein
MANRKCWAECLGNCSDTISGEHIVSKGLFINDLVAVQGLNWCKEEPKIIGINALTKNILCTRHNSTLSPVDEAAIAAFDVFRESVNITNAREVMKERYWNTLHLKIDGNGLERWFLKTLINVASGGKESIGPRSKTAGEPPCDLVEIAYGQRKFLPNAGLYYSAEMGEKIDSEDRVNIIPFFDQKNEFMLGATFYFRGFRFMLNLDEIGFTGNLKFIHKDGRHTSHYSKPLRHLRQIRVTVGPSQKYLSHTIDFNWD